MSKISAIKKIVVEDYDAASRGLIQRLAQTLNSFLEQVTNAINGQLTLRENSKGKVYKVDLPAPAGVTVTMTIASPAVFSKTAHGLVAGDAITFTTTSALPTGIASGAVYYVQATGLTADAFQTAAIPSNSASAVVTSGSQSGTHSLFRVNPTAIVSWGLNEKPTSVVLAQLTKSDFSAPAAMTSLSWRYDSKGIWLTFYGLDASTHHIATVVAQV